MSENSVEDHGPWYKQFWLWFVLAIPAVTILWCIFMITVAVQTRGSMVSDDYSRDGLGINMELARDRKAADLGLNGNIRFDERRVALTLQDGDGFPFLVLNLSHPTLSEKDRRLQLQPVRDGRYETTLATPLEGRWYLDLRGPDNSWRLKGQAALPSDVALPLRPAPQG
ncbi:FixH family protein [Marinobacter sp. JSM 1782161]|uniref:FixH family protein n=1 Tax=Marinobacter sp. JSM 1782161 TaxID=2685906 RepID=UPI0014021BE0|nr:FixH family protein [Marinobacter sp. JSM 1782161]